MVGTLFPDIRYLGEAKRHDTHINHVTLEAVLNESDPFRAGVLFHSYVDEKREALLVEKGVYDPVRKTIPVHTATFIKLVEDEVLCREKNYSDVIVALISILPGEKQYQISESTLNKWHKLLTLYFISSPSFSLNVITLLNKGVGGISAEELKNWNVHLKPMSQEGILNAWTVDLVKYFEDDFSKHKIALVP